MNGPYPKLLNSGPYFPNGVSQSPKLLKLDQLQFRISEFFITEVLEKALSIQEFKEKYEKGFMVRESYIKSFEFLTNRRLPDRHFDLWELFELIGITNFVSPEEAKKLGLIFNNDVLDLYNREELNSLNGDGLEKLNQELKNFQFSSKSGVKEMLVNS